MIAATAVAPAMPAVRTESLEARYRTRRAPALQDVTLAVADGERLILAGPSGGGKSTLALCLAGLIPRSVPADVRGTVTVLDRSMATWRPGDIADHIGVVFQDPGAQMTMLTVEDEVAFGLENLGVPAEEMPRRVATALAAVGLGDRAGWRIDRLSGGQQQRVVLAATLAMRPRILVLDEPTAHLDPRGAGEVYQHVQAIAEREGTTLIVVEHDIDRVVPGLVDRGVLLARNGRVIADGSTQSLFDSAEAAREWTATGAGLPTSTALALAGDEAGSDAPLPLGDDPTARWIANNPARQDRLRAAARASTRTPSDTIVVEADDLSYRYRSPAGDHPALRDVSLRVHESEMVAVVGANGSGKSTLLRALSGLAPPERGRVTIGGRDLYHMRPRDAARLVAHVFQNPESGFVADTVVDEIAYGPRLLGWDSVAIARHVDASLVRFGLESVARAHPFTLSGGQKRRLSIAVALVTGPRLVALDEPTFGQDRRSARMLLDEIALLRDAGLAVIVATHDAELVSEAADRVVALAGGTVLFDGPPHTFATDAELLTATGQERSAVTRILAAARDLGADIPNTLRRCDLDAGLIPTGTERGL